MMWRRIVCITALITLSAALPTSAQAGAPARTGGSNDSAAIASTPDVTPNQREFRDNAFNRQSSRKALMPKAQAASEAAALLAALQLPCTVTDAALIAMGPAEINGRKTDTKTFEASCDSGLGYFVVSADTADAFSCFAAQATSAKDVAEGRQPGITCSLPANANLTAMASTILSHVGVSCSANRVRWIGLSAKSSTEFTEVACTDGRGYVLLSATPGSKAAVASMSCADAAKRGIACSLTQSGVPAITVQTFKDELARHKISCAAADEDIRVVGQETLQKRHVVEFKCTEFPNGLVAFIPLGDNKMPFETLDCANAAKRQVLCKLH